KLNGAKALAWATTTEHGEIKKGEARVPLITRQQVGKGAVIVTLMPNLVGLDERAHPAVPYLMNGLTETLLPVEVRLANGNRPSGEVMYSVNTTNDGWLVALYNHRGLDKTQTGIARVDRQAKCHVALAARQPVADIPEELTQ